MRRLTLLALPAAALLAAPAGALPVYAAKGLVNPATYSFNAAHDGEVMAYFAGQSAGYTSWLGLLVNGSDTGLLGLNNHASAPGQGFSFGHVEAGDALTFFIRVTNTQKTYYSDVSMNGDGLNHVFATPYVGGEQGIPAGMFVGFEDLWNGGDKDYDDLRFVFTNVADPLRVPEPAALGLMLTGAALIGVARRRR